MQPGNGGRRPVADDVLGRSLVERGILSSRDLERARAALASRRARGETLHLSDVLVRDGLVSERDLAAAELANRDTEPTRREFANYDLLEVLGRGGMGVVWKARDRHLKRTVALKLLSSRPEDPMAEERFVREARAAARLSHPAIVRLFDAGIHEGQAFLATEFIDGRSFGNALDEGMPRRRALAVLVEIARGLQFAHDQGIVHRDVKPDNVLIDREGRAHLVDFGLAKELVGDPTSGMTTSGYLVGTPHYMSPEQAESKPGRIGPASDQYSLGVVLYRVLTGRVPFEGGSLRELLLDVWHREPDPPSGIDPSVPAELDAICLRALAKTPEERFPSMADLADELERHAGARAVSREPGSRRSKRVTAVRERPGPSRALLACGAAAILALGVVGGILVGRSSPPDPVPDPAPAAAEEVPARIRSARARLERAEEGYRSETADAMVVLGEARSALDELGEIPARGPGAALGRFVEGWARENLGFPEEAEAAYRAALELDPDLAEARARLAYALALRSFLQSTTLRSGSEDHLARAAELAEEALEIARPAGSLRAGAVARDLAEILVAYARSDFERMRLLALGALERYGDGPGAEWLHWIAGLADHGAESLPRYDRAIRLRPHFPVARFCRALARMAARDPNGALADYEDAIRFQPRFLAAYLNRAGLRVERGDLEGALADYGEALRIDPHLPVARLNRAVIRADRGDLAGAESDVREAIRIDPASVEGRLELGQLLCDRNAHVEAIAQYEEVLRIDPRCARAYFKRANSRQHLGDEAGALADYDQAIALDPRYAQAYVNRSTILGDRGETVRALADLDEAIRLRPDIVAAWINRGILRSELRDGKGALADYDQALRLDPRATAALINRGTLLRRAGALPEARRDYDQAIAIDPTLHEAWYNRGLLRHAQGDLEGSLADVTEAVRLAPTGIAIRLFRGAVFHDLGRCAEAIAECEAVLRLDPREPTAYSNRGASRESQGDREGAIGDYERSLQLAPAGWSHRAYVEERLARLRGGG